MKSTVADCHSHTPPTLARSIRAALVMAALTASQAGYAQVAAPGDTSADDPMDEIIVFGRAERQIGIAEAASEGAVGGDDLLVRPMLRVADLLEAVPGLIAAQHSGSGKANQYFLRGFQLDHGTDFTTYVDDMPWNLRTHGHGQGYLDVNGLIPEIVERIDYRKGPYRADAGDFSMAGSGYLTTIKRLAQPFAAVEYGDYGWGRIAGGGSTEVAGGELTVIAQYKTYDGPWELKEELDHKSMWAKYSRETDFGTWNLSLSGYLANWKPSEQIPESAVGTADCEDEFCSLDPSAYGGTDRWIVTSNWIGEDWRATAYAQFYDWHMLSNPTYEPGAQFDQFDRRWTAGGRYERKFIQSEAVDFTAGSEFRYDHIGNVGLDSTELGTFVGNIANNAVKEGSIAVYGEATWRPTEKLRATAGLRGDLYNFDVAANPGAGDSENVGSTSDNIFSPKLGLAYSLTDNVELYGNWGRGFHSNDARGVVKLVEPVPGLVVGTGYEGGARLEVGSFKVSVAYWWLNLSSELIFVGDDNTVEPKGGSKRHGYEVVAFWRPVDWLGLDFVYAGSNARYEDEQEGGGRFVEGGVEGAGEFGIAATKGDWELSARVRYLGPYPLVPDDSERADAEVMLNLRAAYTYRAVTLYGEVLNILDANGKDIVYFYENSFDPTGGRVSRAEEPRSLRFGVKYAF